MDAAELIQRLARGPASTGLFLDFDGTLAPIVSDPSTSRLPDELAPTLAGLAERLALLAVVSGRPVDFLAERAAVPGVRLLGLYGLQQWEDGRVRVRPEASAWQQAVDTAKARLREAFDAVDGIHVEDKGLSVAVHWRNAVDHARAEGQVAQLTARLAAGSGLAREPGKLVDELRPPVEWDKGTSVRQLAAELRLRQVAYLGDDLGDLAAFAAVRDLGGAAVAVDHGAETPPRLLEAADVVLPAGGVGSWLRDLLTALSR